MPYMSFKVTKEFIFRVLFIDGSKLSNGNLIGQAEEQCICNFHGYGCIVTFAVSNSEDWSENLKVFTHEIGHTLGMPTHDDDHYNADYNSKRLALMWSSTDHGAFIWSPKTRAEIKKHDKSCLKDFKDLQ